MNRRILPAILTLIGIPICAPARVKSLPGGYIAAECFKDKLTVFPAGKNPTTIPLPTGLTCAGFRADGKALYASVPFEELEPGPQVPRQRHFEIQFNPTRVSESPGFNLPGFRVYDHVESQNEDHSVFAGQPRGSPPGTCGIYDSDVLGGNIRHVMEISGCNQWVVGGKFSLSPDGEQLLIAHTADWN